MRSRRGRDHRSHVAALLPRALAERCVGNSSPPHLPGAQSLKTCCGRSHVVVVTGAAIYNIIPDVLSRLSAAESVDSDMFKRVMKHLLSLIEKVRGTPSSTHLFPSLICWSHETLSLSLCSIHTSGKAIGEPHGEALPSPPHGQRYKVAPRIPHSAYVYVSTLEHCASPCVAHAWLHQRRNRRTLPTASRS